jgi:hypothetical protein
MAIMLMPATNDVTKVFNFMGILLIEIDKRVAGGLQIAAILIDHHALNFLPEKTAQVA